jgi:hypothetical protein
MALPRLACLALITLTLCASCGKTPDLGLPPYQPGPTPALLPTEDLFPEGLTDGVGADEAAALAARGADLRKRAAAAT